MSVLFSYCFRPYKWASFDVMVSHLLRRRQGKSRLSSATRRETSKKYPYSTPVALNLCLSIDQRFSLLENVNLVRFHTMSHGLKWTAEPAYNLISSRLLWVWVSCGANERIYLPRMRNSKIRNSTYNLTVQLWDYIKNLIKIILI